MSDRYLFFMDFLEYFSDLIYSEENIVVNQYISIILYLLAFILPFEHLFPADQIRTADCRMDYLKLM
jgi:hypothetical protein